MDNVPQFLRELADLIEKHNSKDIVPPQITLNGVEQIPGMEVVPIPVEFVHRVPQQPLWDGEVWKQYVNVVCTDSDQCRGK